MRLARDWYALFDPPPQSVPASEMASGDAEALRSLVTMVKAQRAQAPRVAASLASAAHRFDESQFQRLSSLATASIRTARIAHTPRVSFPPVVRIGPPAAEACAAAVPRR